MVHRLRPEPLSFVERAPVRFTYQARLTAPPDAVFAELAEDAATWPQWFRAIRRAGYAGGSPYGVGTGRVIRLRGGVRYVETVIAWDPAERYAYRIEETNAPGVRAQIEDWRLSLSEDGGTLLTWTMAIAPVAPLAPLLSLARAPIGRVFREAAARLDARATKRS